MKVFYISILSLIILSACNRNVDKKKEVVADTINYTYKTYYLASNNVVENDGQKDTSYYKVVYPSFNKKEINELVSKQFITNINPDTQYNSIEEEGKAFIANFDDFIKMDEYPRAWYSELNAKVIQNTKDYLALSIDLNNYTGGAHGNYSTLYLNYDLSKNDTLGLHDIIPQIKYPQLTKIGEDIFRKQENLTADQTLGDSYFFEDNAFHLNSNFTLTSKGLLFLYNIYEIKPYAAGSTKLLIPYQLIDSLMTDRGKLIQSQLK